MKAFNAIINSLIPLAENKLIVINCRLYEEISPPEYAKLLERCPGVTFVAISMHRRDDIIDFN